MKNDEKLIAEIVPAVKLPRNVSHFFSYEIPVELYDNLKIGMMVDIPFGKKNIQGIVFKISKKNCKEIDFKLKQIKSITVNNILISNEQIKLARFISDYYYTPLSTVIKMMLPSITKNKPRKEIELNFQTEITKIKEKEVENIITNIERKNNVLLIHNLNEERHSLYHKIIRKTIRQTTMTKGQTLILFPESFDIYNFTNFYINKFGKKKVAILSSELTKNQYFQEWNKIKNGTAEIIIGTRLALFAPFQNLKLLIADDEHNSSYKQWDQNPRYHSIKTAKELAKIWKAKIILSSPAPSIEEYYQANKQNSNLKIVFFLKNKTKYTIVNMEDERKKGNYSPLSEKVKETLLENIYNRKQVILFIPRLGKHTATKCRDCGYIAECEHCQNILIIQNNFLFCTKCNKKIKIIQECPKCHSKRIVSFGSGSEEIENKINDLFKEKNIKITRLDSNTNKTIKDSLGIQKDFTIGKIDILIGTQMVLKNWSIKNLATIVILFPEITFNQPNFKSQEKTFQFFKFISTLRNDNLELIIETNDFENKTFNLLKKDITNFYKTEIEKRKLTSEISYPPFSQLIKLIYKNKNQFQCQNETKKMYEFLKMKIFENENLKNNFQITTPFASSNLKEYGKYRWQIIIKSICEDTKLRNLLLNYVKKDWIIDIDPDNIS